MTPTKPCPDLDLLYALCEAGVFGRRPTFSQSGLARVMGCTAGNLYMLEQSILRKIRRKAAAVGLLQTYREMKGKA